MHAAVSRAICRTRLSVGARAAAGFSGVTGDRFVHRLCSAGSHGLATEAHVQVVGQAHRASVAADQYKGRVKVGKLDVDAHGATSSRFNIRGIPTLLLFKGGQVKEQIVGAVGKEVITKALDKHLA